MTCFKVATEKTHTYVNAASLAQARVAAAQVFPKEEVVITEATQAEVDSLIRSHSLPMREH